MKLKIDFVTNSSSAAFMLMIKIDGYMPLLGIPNLVEYFRDLDYRVRSSRPSKYYSVDDQSLIFHVNPHDDTIEQTPKYTLETEKISGYNEKDQVEYDKMRISLVGENSNYFNEDSLSNTKDVAAIILQNLIHSYKTPIRKRDVQFLIRIEPTKFWGDGWDGDAMGPYQQIPEAIEGETKFGSLFLNKNNLLEFQLYNLAGKLVVKGPPGI